MMMMMMLCMQKDNAISFLGVEKAPFRNALRKKETLHS